MADPDDLHTVWCRADPSPLVPGAYLLTISYDDDNVLPLTRTDLLDYVAVMSDALTRAVYREAVRRQLRDQLRLSDRHAVETIVELSDDWPELRRFGQYEIRPCTSIEGRPSVQVWRGDTIVVQFAPHNVHEHINHALQTYAAGDLDAAYRRYLIGVIGAPPDTAGQAVGALSQYMPTEEDDHGLDRIPQKPRPRRPGRKRR